MKKVLVLLVLISVAAAMPAFIPNVSAGESAKKPASRLGSLKTWFRTWKLALRKKAIQSRYRRGVSVTSVAAVRGDKQSEADPKLPYWKGSWSDKKAAQRLEERKEQSAASDLILDGKFDEAEKALDAFEKAHPKSAYLADIREARIKMAELKAGEKSVEKKPAATEPKGEKEAAPSKSPKD